MSIVVKRRKEGGTLTGAELHPLLRRIYSARGVTSLNELERSLERLHPYNSLQSIDKAVAVLFEALQKQSRIIVIGDFDADGATSTALLVSALRAFGAEHVSYLVPNRFEYGYGLTPEIVEVAAKQSPDLLITVDNGISSIAGVAKANEKNIDVLITDHHLPGGVLPDAVAIVNPNQVGDEFPSKNLAGVGVIFYVMLALRAHLREKKWFSERHIKEPNMADWLDLVALGTVADVVPLDRNNRILVHQGLRRIRAGYCRQGIKALLEIANRLPHRIVASDLGFVVGPRLNAAGRLDDMSLGIECLLREDPAATKIMAEQLDELNKERRSIESDMRDQAQKIVANLKISNDLPLGLCLFDESWHQGVIGIVAGRIKEQLHRPVIACALMNDDELKGSARSVNGVHIRDVLDAIATKHEGLINKFGGHAMAAGLSLPRKNLEAFQQAFADEIKNHLSESDLTGKIHSDGELAEQDFALELAELLRESGPWGQAFPEPIFDGEFELIDQRLVGQNHLKMVLAVGSQMIDAIAFNIDLKQWPNTRCQKIYAAYRLDVNEFRGRRSVQLIIEHFEST